MNIDTSSLEQFNNSVPGAIDSITGFISNVTTECEALLDVIPVSLKILMIACLGFTVVLAIKRMVID